MVTPVVTIARRFWRRLTSMRTALVLLFLLAVAAVPGSLLPQRPLNPDKTSSYIKSHGAVGTFLNHIGMFDVFGSAWFAAIYLLLFISLVGCLIPRIRVHARAMMRKPLPAPRNLDRLPESGSFTTTLAPTPALDATQRALGRRWRTTRREEPSGAITLSAEKGYSRETGNLVFHVALLLALVLIAVGRLYSYQSTTIVVQGQGFCNGVFPDAWKPGRLASEGKVHPAPFCVTELKSFTAKYSASAEPTEFKAVVDYKDDPGSSKIKTTSISVNHPLRLEGDRVYLINHGFAPTITVTMPDGTTRTDTQAFIPTNPTTLYSEGAFKEQGKPDANQDIGVQGFFAPTPVDDGTGVISSSSPEVSNPVLGIFVWKGNLNYTGLPQSVYSLDTSKMTKIGAANLAIGKSVTLPGGVSVRFDGWKPWVSFQVSHDPSQGYLLGLAVAMVVGLLGSLGVRRRRIWIRIGPDSGLAPEADGRSPTVVKVGGLARSDSGNFSTEFTELLRRLTTAGKTGVVDEAGAGEDDRLPDEHEPVGAGKE